MTGMLASVNSLPEALLALKADVDIIDLKQPAQGALGALATQDVREIVQAITGRIPVSATIGDMPMHPECVTEAVMAMAETGVDYVKIGFFPEGDWQATVKHLQVFNTPLKYRLIAVLFADCQPDSAFISVLADHGFAGVMLDTQDKRKGSLTGVMPQLMISQFVNQARTTGLLCGLAGSLRLNDIAQLLPLQPDYLGFRGALCAQHERTAQLDETRLWQIRHALKNAL